MTGYVSFVLDVLFADPDGFDAAERDLYGFDEPVVVEFHSVDAGLAVVHVPYRRAAGGGRRCTTRPCPGCGSRSGVRRRWPPRDPAAGSSDALEGSERRVCDA